MYDGPIIDAHHHLWEVKNYPWLLAPASPKIFGDKYEELRQDYLIEDLISDFGAYNITKSVHVQAHYDSSDPVGETKWLQSIADKHGFPHGIAGYAKLSDPLVEKVLSSHCFYPNFRAVRDVVYWQENNPVRQAVDRPDFCLKNDYRNGVSLLEKYGLTLELQGFPNQFIYFSELVSDNPGVNFCLVHGGLLTSDDDEIFEKWKTALLPLVNHENVFIKCSATQLFGFGGVRRSQHHISRQYNMLLDLFGAGRCFFGSNFPVEKLKSTYSDMMNIYIEAIKNRPEEDQSAFFHNTAERFYRL